MDFPHLCKANSGPSHHNIIIDCLGEICMIFRLIIYCHHRCHILYWIYRDKKIKWFGHFGEGSPVRCHFVHEAPETAKRRPNIRWGDSIYANSAQHNLGNTFHSGLNALTHFILNEQLQPQARFFPRYF